MTFSEEDEIKDLKRYFKIVRKCKICSTLYGLDKTQESFPFTCPRCHKNRWGKKGKK